MSPEKNKKIGNKKGRPRKRLQKRGKNFLQAFIGTPWSSCRSHTQRDHLAYTFSVLAVLRDSGRICMQAVLCKYSRIEDEPKRALLEIHTTYLQLSSIYEPRANATKRPKTQFCSVILMMTGCDQPAGQSAGALVVAAQCFLFPLPRNYHTSAAHSETLTSFLAITRTHGIGIWGRFPCNNIMSSSSTGWQLAAGTCGVAWKNTTQARGHPKCKQAYRCLFPAHTSNTLVRQTLRSSRFVGARGPSSV